MVDQPGVSQPVDQFDRGVVANPQSLGEIATVLAAHE